MSVISGTASSNFKNIGTKAANVEAALDPKRERKLINAYPDFARNRYKALTMLEERMDAQREAFFVQAQNKRSEISKLNTDKRSNVSRLHGVSLRDRTILEAENAAIDEQIAEKREELIALEVEKKALVNPISVDEVRKYMIRASGKRFTEYVPKLPAQSPEKDVKALADIREKIDSIDGTIHQIEIGSLPEKIARDAAFAQIDKLASAPDFSPLLRLSKNGFDDRRAQGKIKWPTRYVGGRDEFEPDGFQLVLWLMKSELKARATAEIKALAKPDALTEAERAEKIEALKSEQFDLWRIEEAIVTRLREAGRLDINYRRGTPIPVLLRLC
jgi:ribosomal protein L29